MSWGMVAVAGATLVGGVMSSKAQKKAGEAAAGAQSEAAEAGIEEQSRQFDAIQALLKPYVSAGTGALTAQQDIAGLNGVDARRAALMQIEGSPEFQALFQQGENAILQNASATGGLRGGNVQGALAKFRPSLLSAQINDQYARLGGISSMGLGAATQTGQFGQASTNNVTSLLQQQGAALAGGAIARGNAQAGYGAALGNAAGLYAGMSRPAGGVGDGRSWYEQFRGINFGGAGGPY